MSFVPVPRRVARMFRDTKLVLLPRPVVLRAGERLPPIPGAAVASLFITRRSNTSTVKP
jgi:hypothetical protein